MITWEQLEEYCYLNGWTIDRRPGYVAFIKGDKIIHEKFLMLMDSDDILDKLKYHDMEKEKEIQGEFVF